MTLEKRFVLAGLFILILVRKRSDLIAEIVWLFSLFELVFDLENMMGQT